MVESTHKHSAQETMRAPEAEKVLEKEWGHLTERIRKDVQSDIPTRKALLHYFSEPLNETYAYRSVVSLGSVNPALKKLLDRYDHTLVDFLCEPPIPQSRIPVDLQRAVRAHDRGEGGITRKEFYEVACRYRYARDIKILSFAAQLLEGGELPPGAWMTFGHISDQEEGDFRNPLTWKWRKQMKDRVFEIGVDNRRYILKEHKTNRHTDTLQGGHEEGLPSYGEFAMSQDLFEHASSATPTDPHVRVSWERPIAAAHFPDGYEFTVFEYEKDLVGEYDLEFALLDLAKDHSDDFQSLYAPYANILTYEQFTPVLAMRLEERAIDALQAYAYSRGIHPHDIGWGIRILSTRPYIQIVGMDVEYASPLYSESAKTLLDMYKEEKQRERLERDFSGVIWLDGTPMTEMQISAYRDMVRQDREEK